ncbi:MAG: hypothetical protein GYA17_02910 [Chloroflexi bacterium]|jgi:hypothetical protein|nr:hypothetical protein [Anaerolineaceae bacterium]NMB87281.1 hypothetical protein [Chloroflexota bacterium]
MKPDRLFLICTLLLVVAAGAACAPLAAPAEGATLAPGTPAPAILTWERSGGITGLCQRLEVTQAMTYHLEDCRRDVLLGQGDLPAEVQRQLASWQQSYATYTWETTPPAGAADMFIDRYTFTGQGSQTPGRQEQEAIDQAIAAWVNKLVSGAAPGPTPTGG